MIVCRVPIQVMKSVAHLRSRGCPDAHVVADNEYVQLFYHDGNWNTIHQPGVGQAVEDHLHGCYFDGAEDEDSGRRFNKGFPKENQNG